MGGLTVLNKWFFFFFFSPSDEEQLIKCCPCGNCSTFDRDLPRDTSSVREEWNNGCVLRSHWLPDEIKHCASIGFIEGLAQQYGTVDHQTCIKRSPLGNGQLTA